MDVDIQFGEVEEERPRVMRRPDENRHYAVAACGAPAENELRVFVDLDAMAEMEAHAQSNTNVELGGVLLGGQYVDHDGREFVVVTDCLRADHYEATKGSFKFTHDTWSDIQRRLEEFPEELRMVGWYHTHPDWGVFLSGMDLFICENFFNKPLDLALVIDPCRGDRGWFQWTRHRRGPQRMGGFYLTSSRFREEELEFFARTLEDSQAMPVATRSGSQTSGGYGAPVVNVVQDRSSQWTQVAVLGSLALQTLLVALIAWAMIGSRPGTSSGELDEVKKQQAVLDVRRETLEDIAQRMTDVDKDFVKDFEQSEIERKSLETALVSASRVVKNHEADISELKKLVAGWEEHGKRLDDKNSTLLAENKALKTELTALRKEAGEDKSIIDFKSPWLWAFAVAALALATLGTIMLRSPRPSQDDFITSDEPPRRSSPPDESKDPVDDANTRGGNDQ